MDARTDPERPLSKCGREEIRHLGEWCRRKEVRPAEIWHSPKARARETAALLAEFMGLPGGAVERAGLLPEDPVSPIAALLDSATRDICIVSHLPFVDVLSRHLAGEPGDRRFSTGSMWCASRDGRGVWTRGWFISPGT